MNSYFPLCEVCEKRACAADSDMCPDCRDNAAEAAWERQNDDGETFRGSEAAAYSAAEQARIQRELK